MERNISEEALNELKSTLEQIQNNITSAEAET
jgi:hypothetical protein